MKPLLFLCIPFTSYGAQSVLKSIVLAFLLSNSRYFQSKLKAANFPRMPDLYMKYIQKCSMMPLIFALHAHNRKYRYCKAFFLLWGFPSTPCDLTWISRTIVTQMFVFVSGYLNLTKTVIDMRFPAHPEYFLKYLFVRYVQYHILKVYKNNVN